MNEENYLNAIEKNLEKGDKISLRQATLNLIDLYDLLVTETLSKINLSNYNNVDFNKKSMLIGLLLELSEETTTTLKDIWKKIRGKFAHNREYFTPPEITQDYLAKYQSVVKEFNDKIPSILTPNYLKQLWEAEAELFPKPSANSFIEIFENINNFPDLPLNDLYKEKLSLGLLEYHLMVDLTIPSNTILKLLLDEIFHRIDESIFNLESFVSLLNSLNKNRQGFFDHYRADDKRTCKLLGSNWYKVLESDYNPDVLNAFIREIRKADSLVSDDFCKMIFDYFAKSFPVSFSQNKNLILLNNISKIHSEIIHLLPKLTWERVERIKISDLEPLLNGINTIILQIIASYEEGLEKHQTNFADEEKQVKNSFIYAFYKELLKNIRWGELEWETLSVNDISNVFNQFTRHVSFPEAILNFNWNSYLREAWQKTPENVLLFLEDEYKFRSLLLKDYPKEDKFPEMKDFLSKKNLGLLNYFIMHILASSFFDRSKTFDFLNQSSFSPDNLKQLINDSYYPTIHDFQKILQKHYPTKMVDFQPLVKESIGKSKYLNRYHEALSLVINKSSDSLIVDSQDFIETTSSFESEYSWYWPLLTLPCFWDVLLLFDDLIKDDEKEAFIRRIVDSLREDSSIWNDLFDYNFYIKSFQDFYPGSQANNFLKKRERFSQREPNFEELKQFHYLGLTFFFHRISETKIFHPILECLIDRTDFLEHIFDTTSFNMIKWKESVPHHYDHDWIFRLSRQKIEDYAFTTFLRRSVYYSPIETFILLLSNKKSISSRIMKKMKEIELDAFYPHPQDVATKYPEIFAETLTKITEKGNGILTEYTEMWRELFGLTRLKKPITSLEIDFETLEMIDHFPKEKDAVIEAINWKYHLPQMNPKEIAKFYILFKKNFFKKRGSETHNDSFIAGILKVFPKWYELAVKEFSNRLVSLTGLVYLSKQIENTHYQKEYLKKLRNKLEEEDWNNLISNNLEEEDPLREILNFFEVINDFQELELFETRILDQLVSDKKTFTAHFRTFWEVNALLVWLVERIRKNKDLFESYLLRFFTLTKKLSLTIKPTRYYGEIGDLLNFLRSKTLEIPEMQHILIRGKFFEKLKNHFIEKIEEESYFCSYIPNILTELTNIEPLGLVDSKSFICRILDSISMKKLFFEKETVYVLKNLLQKGKENDDFIELLSETEQFQTLDWTKISKHESWHSYLSFVKEITTHNEKLPRVIVSNPTFWDIKWIDYIKTWLLGCNKEIITFFTFLDSFSDEHFVKSFLTSSKLLKCPWENCYSQILNRSKESSSLLSKEEFVNLVELLAKFNSAFENLMKSK